MKKNSMKNPPRKLTLHFETIRDLETRDLAAAAGGRPSNECDATISCVTAC